MNFELHNGLANFGTKFGILWQKFCEIDCKSDVLLGKVKFAIYWTRKLLTTNISFCEYQYLNRTNLSTKVCILVAYTYLSIIVHYEFQNISTVHQRQNIVEEEGQIGIQVFGPGRLL